MLLLALGAFTDMQSFSILVRYIRPHPAVVHVVAALSTRHFMTRVLDLHPQLHFPCKLHKVISIKHTHFVESACSVSRHRPAQMWLLLQEPTVSGTEQVSEAVLRRTFSLAAQYILLSYVLQPAKDVYSKSLQVIKQLLPLPHLRAGRLLAVAPDSLDSVPERWLLSLFVLDQSGFKTVAPHDQPFEKLAQPADTAPQEANGEMEAQHAQHDADSTDRHQGTSYKIELSDMACVKPCNDPSLPPGYAFWISMHSRTQGFYFVAEVSEDAEGWVDALHMASYAAKQGRMQLLGKALATASGEPQYRSQLDSNAAPLDAK